MDTLWLIWSIFQFRHDPCCNILIGRCRNIGIRKVVYKNITIIRDWNEVFHMFEIEYGAIESLCFVCFWSVYNCLRASFNNTGYQFHQITPSLM